MPNPVQFDESKHPRGQPENAGEFGPTGNKAGATNTHAERLAEHAQQLPEHIDPAEDYQKNGTRAKAFLAWFGDYENDPANSSKVVNKEGEPQETHNIPGTGSKVMKDGKPVTVYHGTAHGGFDVFDKSGLDRKALYGPGFYFTEDEGVAKEYTTAHLPVYLPEDVANKEKDIATIKRKMADYGDWNGAYATRLADAEKTLKEMQASQAAKREVKAVFLNIRKPFDLDKQKVTAAQLNLPAKYIQQTLGGDANYAKTVDDWKEHFHEEWFPKELLGEEGEEGKFGFGRKTTKPDGTPDPYGITQLHTFPSHYMRVQLQKLGYDGFTHIGGDTMGKGHHHRVWIAFEPNQIKATNNKGTFDPKQDNITLSASFEEQVATVSEHQQAADALTVQILKRAEAGGLAISQEVRRLAMALMRKLAATNPAPTKLLADFLHGFRAILRQYEGTLARTISDSVLAGHLHGAKSVLATLEIPIDPWLNYGNILPIKQGTPIVRFAIIDEAARSMQSHSILTPNLLGQAHRQAQQEGFHAARTGSLDALEKVRDALTEAVVEGDSFETFQDKVGPALDASGLSPSRQEMLFRNVVLPAYSRGQKAVVQSPLVRSVAVFAWRANIGDSRCTELCKALSSGGFQGTGIYLTQSETWRLVAPQSHFGCRCGAVYLTVKRAAQKGIKIAQQWLETGMRPSDEELFVPVPDLSGLPDSERLAFASWRSPWAG